MNLILIRFQITYILNLLLFVHPSSLLFINMELICVNYYKNILLFSIFTPKNLFVKLLFSFLSL